MLVDRVEPVKYAQISKNCFLEEVEEILEGRYGDLLLSIYLENY